MTVRRVTIAAPEGLSAVPFVYGIEHANLLHADLLLSSVPKAAEAFEAGRADIALLDIGELTRIKDADIVSSYCVGYNSASGVCTIAGSVPPEKIERIFYTRDAFTESLYAGILVGKKRGVRAVAECVDSLPAKEDMNEGDACIFTGRKAAALSAGFTHVYDLAELWCKSERLPLVQAVWVAGKSVDNATLDALEQSLTFSLEHMWEAAEGFSGEAAADAYDFLTCKTDYIFDNQKNKALKKFWDSGLKITLRINPG